MKEKRKIRALIKMVQFAACIEELIQSACLIKDQSHYNERQSKMGE